VIYDRTQEDVNNAKAIREEKVKKFLPLTEDDINTLERGTLTINTLNRIESKQAELKALLDDVYYFTAPFVTKTWGYTDVFTQEEFNRILNNLEKLKTAFYVFADSPLIPTDNYRRYEIINDTEKLLVDLEKMLDDLKSLWKECGTFSCGEEK
jgi:hypothetical protein